MKRITNGYFILLLLALLNAQHLTAQTQHSIPPSPTASALGSYVDNPVSYFTGTPSISIPLYELKTKDFTLPISLSYNPQEIKVANSASNVGLGWSLNAGGVITRAVKDFPDDMRKGNCGSLNLDKRFGDFGPPPLNEYPWWTHCRWGYLYAIEESSPTSYPGSLGNYLGTSTYNLDLDAIYANRGTPSTNSLVEEAIIRNFGDDSWTYTSNALYNVGLDYDGVGRFGSFVSAQAVPQADMEPDIFYFNFLGYLGKFFFDVESGTPKIHTVPYQHLEFTYETDTTSGNLTGFIATDIKGVKYTFKDIEFSRAYSGNKSSSAGNNTSQTSYNSSWWLSKIETPMGEVINFTYEDLFSEMELDISYTMTVVRLLTGMADIGDPRNPSPFWTTLSSFPRRLKQITSDHVQINFKPSGEPREDTYSSYAIEEISIRHRNELIKSFQLEHDYFTSTESNPILLANSSHGLYHEGQHNEVWFQLNYDKDYFKKRLRLRSIQEFGKLHRALPKISFEYDYYDFNNDNDKMFPNKLSYNTDLWGFANGASNPDPLPTFHIYPDHYQKGDLRMFSVYPKSSYTGRYFHLPGANRLPGADKMTAGVLTKVIYPTGGSTSYQWEPHRFIIDNEEFEGGGLRIQQIVKDNGAGNDLVYNYKYTQAINNTISSGRIVSLPFFASLPQTNYITDRDEWKETFPTFEDALINSIGQYSTSVNGLGSSNGGNFGYTKVYEYLSSSPTSTTLDNGYTEYSFSFPASFGESNDTVGSDCIIAQNGECDGLYKMTRVHNFFMYGYSRSEADLQYYPESSLSHLTPPNPNYRWNRGKLLKTSTYNKDGNVVKEEINEYELYFPNGANEPKKIYGIRMGVFDPETYFSDSWSEKYPFRVAKYEVLTDVAKTLSKKTLVQYDLTAEKSISQTKEYSYSSKHHMNPTSIISYNSVGQKITTKLSYPPDYDHNSNVHDDGIHALVAKNISNVPIEVSEFIDKSGTEYLTSSKLSTFGLVNDLPVKVKDHIFENAISEDDFYESFVDPATGKFIKDSRYSQVSSFKKYDTSGNLLELLDKDRVTTSYIWGYDEKYIIAKVVNAAYDDISSALGSTLSVLNSSRDHTKPGAPYFLDNEMRNMMGILRTQLPSAKVFIYTYKPFVGITSETDPNGIITSYHYDYFGRLKLVKDHQGNIIKKYNYQYKAK